MFAGRMQRVTRIVGMETFLLEPQPLAVALQRRFAAAAGANKVPGVKTGGACEVIVQGDVAAKVRCSCAGGMNPAWCTDRCPPCQNTLQPRCNNSAFGSCALQYMDR